MNIHVTIIEDEERFAQDLTEKIFIPSSGSCGEIGILLSSYFSQQLHLQPVLYIFWISR